MDETPDLTKPRLPRLRAPRVMPGLEPGLCLDRKTFHERYCATPEDYRAELVEGIVVIPPPATVAHGSTLAALVTLLGTYDMHTPGVQGIGAVTLILGEKSEPHPDGMLYIEPELGGQCRIVDEYLTGPPELLCEVAYFGEAVDMHGKYRDYEKACVLEYVVILLHEQTVRWFALREGRFECLTSDGAGVFRSLVFPGLWLDSVALFGNDGAALLATLQQGVQSPEHAAFVQGLKARGPQPQVGSGP